MTPLNAGLETAAAPTKGGPGADNRKQELKKAALASIEQESEAHIPYELRPAQPS